MSQRTDTARGARLGGCVLALFARRRGGRLVLVVARGGRVQAVTRDRSVQAVTRGGRVVAVTRGGRVLAVAMPRGCVVL